MVSTGSMASQCERCHEGLGLWQAAFTSECGHTFHLRCVSGTAVCPACSARWRDTPSMTPAPTQTNPFAFGISSSSTQPQTSTGLFGGGEFPSALVNAFNACAVCHGVVSRGQVSVKSECSHTFHLRCMTGTSVCPACNARWRDYVANIPSSSPIAPSFSFSGQTPFAFPAVQAVQPPTPPFGFSFQPLTTPFQFQPPSQPVRADTESRVFDDDEPVEPPAHAAPLVHESESGGALVINAHCEHPAVARGAQHDNFAVLIHAKAPGAYAAATRAPIDLVTVLDVSGSMTGAKLALLKSAMGFVIDKLGPADRLSVVSFSCEAGRVIRLTRMSDGGKAAAKSAVLSLAAHGSTDIRKGLAEAAKVLDGRRHRNAVASVILLSDGQDTYNLGPNSGSFPFRSNNSSSFGYGTKNYRHLVPSSLMSSSTGSRPTPVHTFGFGTDHDAAAMNTIAEATGGTFSFVENQVVVQDSFAQCIGGLLSVAVQEAWLTVASAHPGVRVRSVKSGLYESRVEAYGRAASVDLGELYADEERRFLLFLDVPAAGVSDDVTRLVEVRCTYRDAATGRLAYAACADAVLQRPVEATNLPPPSMEVRRELFRVEVTEDIAAAQAAAERGEHGEAARILDRRQEALRLSTAGLADDARCLALVSELRELSARVADRREYEQTGRACMLAGMSSHAQQRTSSVQLFGAAGFGLAGTPAFGAAAPCLTFGGYATPQCRVWSSRRGRHARRTSRLPQGRRREASLFPARMMTRRLIYCSSAPD